MRFRYPLSNEFTTFSYDQPHWEAPRSCCGLSRHGSSTALSQVALSVGQAGRQLLNQGAAGDLEVIQTALELGDLLFAVAHSQHQLLGLVRKAVDGVIAVTDGENRLLFDSCWRLTSISRDISHQRM